MARAKKDKTEDDLIRENARDVALATKGVHSLSGKGVKIDHLQDGIEINVSINVVFGCRIPEVAWDTQENIMRTAEKITSQKIKKVNINIQGVE